MPTQTKENYLKALFYLHQKDPLISLTDLSKDLGVSMPTVNDMVKKLQAKGWVVYTKYKPLQFTEAGTRQAAMIIRKHRLAEMFLSQVMGFGWEEVHDMAEEMEHLKLEQFFDRMDELLGFPTVDPHGSPIPNKEGIFTKTTYLPISELAIGKKVVLRALKNSSTEFLLYLNKKEIKLGTMLKIEDREPFDNSLSVSYNDQANVVLSEAICDCLLVEEV